MRRSRRKTRNFIPNFSKSREYCQLKVRTLCPSQIDTALIKEDRYSDLAPLGKLKEEKIRLPGSTSEDPVIKSTHFDEILNEFKAHSSGLG